MFIPKSAPSALTVSLCLASMGLSAHAQTSAPDITTLTASDAVRQICAGTLSSEQLVSAYLAQAKAKPNLNAFITLDETGALKAARAADSSRRRGGACKPLAGLPVVIKDNIQVQGFAGHSRHACTEGFRATRPTRRWSPGCARPAPSSWARPTCTSWPSA